MIQIKRGAATVATVNPLSSSNMTKAMMGDEQITLVWEAPAFVSYYLGDYITFEGANWTLNKLPTVKKLSSKTWQYNAVFQSTKYELIKAMYLLFDNTNTPPLNEFPLTGTADTFMELLVANLNRVAGSAVWSIGQVIENTDYKNLTFSDEDCLSVLARLASEFNTEYHISNHVIHLKRISTVRQITLEYGSTLYDIERSSVDSSDVVTRLYPVGSTRNLASTYRGGNTPLRLPAVNGNYIERNVDLYGVIERSHTFEDVYPRLSAGAAGVVTAIGDEFTFTDAALDFNVNNCLLNGTTAKVHFNTGQCAGYDFEIRQFNVNTKTFTLIANTQENDFTLPTTDLKPAVGDKYVLLDIIMPDSYLTAAETELLTRAQEYINQNSTPAVEYKTTFSAIYAKQNLQNVECGDTVTVYDEDMGIDEQIRIIKLQKGLTDFWTVQFDLSNTVTATRLERIEGNVAAVENTVIVTNQRVNRNNLRAYQQTKELQEMVFDPDGYFDPQNIKPLSIETTMVSVSAKSQIFQLSSLFQPNYAANPQVMQWSAGLLTHFTISDNAITEWIISQGSITITGDNQAKALYIYARCLRSGSAGDIHLSPVALKFNEGSTYYYFLIGVLHTPINDVRGISLSYGQTTINGQFIKTGVITSIDGATYFNLNTGEIGGNIKFRSTSGTLKDIPTALTETQSSAANDATDKAEAARVAAVNAAAADAANKVNAIKIGSQNKLNGTRTLTGWNQAGGGYLNGTYNNLAVYSSDSAWGYYWQYLNVELGKTYIIGAYVKVNNACAIYPIIGIDGDDTRYSGWEISEVGVWLWKTLIITIDGVHHKPGIATLRVEGNQGGYSVCGFTVVEGNVNISGWMPSLADTQAEIEANNAYINTIKSDLQNQIDGVVDSWFFPYTPSLDNEPASLWTDDTQRGRHVGDTFTSTQVFVSNEQTPDAGKSWRWAYSNGAYGWTPIADSDAVKALLAASKAQDTADNKKRVFTTQPFTPYDAGDLWAQGANGDFMKCDVSRASGAYVASDWSKSSKYTDDTAVNNLKIGGVNLLRNSKARRENIFVLYNEYLTNPLIAGNTYILSSGNRSDTIDQKYLRMPNSFDYHQTIEFNVPFTATDDWSMIVLAGIYGAVNFIEKLKLELGNKETDYTEAPEDIASDIATAKQAGTDAQNTANLAFEAVSDLDSYMSNAFRDGVIDESEKKAIKEHRNVIESIFQPLDNAYTVLVQNGYLEGAAKTGLIQAKVSLNGCRSDIINAILAIVNAQTVTDALYDYYSDRYSDFQSAVADFNLAVENANKAIQQKLDSLSTAKVEAVVTGTVNLIRNSKGDFTPWNGNAGDNFVYYPELKCYLEQGKTYVVRGKVVGGVWSNIHGTPGTNATFWLTNAAHSFHQVISDSATITGTVFTFNFASQECIVRLNGYNDNSDGHLRFSELMIVEGNKISPNWTASPLDIDAKFLATKFISDAISETTEIDGGLALLTALLTRYNNVVSAGMLAKTPTNNIAMFAGGTLEEAIAKTSKFGVTHDGDAWLRGLIEATSGKIGGLNISNNSLISDSMSFSESPVETLSELLNPQTYSISYQSTWEKEVFIEQGVDIDSCLAYSQELVLPIDCTLKFKATCIPDSAGIAENPEDATYTIYVNGTNGRVYTKSGVGSITGYQVNLNLPAGTYQIYAQADTLITPGSNETTTMYARIYGVASEASIVAAGFVNKSKIGNNGLFSFWDVLKYLYYSKEEGLIVRGKSDVPMLGGGSSYSSGGVVYTWGKVTAGNRNSSTTTITHSAGAANGYSVILTPYGSSMPYISNKGTNTLSIYCAGSFDFVLVRTI